MTVLGTRTRQDFAIIGGTTYDLAPDFLFLEDYNIFCVETLADGTTRDLVLGTDYTVSGGDGGSGTVTTMQVLTGQKLTVYRDVEAIQQYDARVGDGFNTDTFERQLDRMVMAIQETERIAGDSITLPITTPEDVSNVLPPPEAHKYIRWNSSATMFENVDGTIPVATVESQTLSDGQTIVNFTNDTSVASFVINGPNCDNGRLLGGVDYTLQGNTMTLTQSYPAGTIITMAYSDFNAGVLAPPSEPEYIKSYETIDLIRDAEQEGSAYLADEKRNGMFSWDPSDLSAEVANDPLSGGYIAPSSDLSGASGAWVRRYDEPINATWFGAVGDGVTDISDVIHELEGYGKATVFPQGEYKIDDAGNYGTPFLGFNIDFIDGANVFTSFTDLGRKALFKKMYRSENEYTDTPTSYTNLFEFSGFHLNHLNTMGYQENYDTDEGGRTMVPGYSVDGSHQGEGDVCAFYGNYGVAAHDNAGSVYQWTGANSGTITAGQVGCLTSKTNAYGAEFHITNTDYQGGGYRDTSGLGMVVSLERYITNADTYHTLWAGVRVQADTGYPMDVAFQAIGKATIGLDFSGVDFEQIGGDDSKCAIALKAEDRIYFDFDKKVAPNWHGFQPDLPRETYMEFDGVKYDFVTEGVVHFQTSDSATVVVGGFSVYKEDLLVMDVCNADESFIYIGNTGKHVSINGTLHLTGPTTSSTATAGTADPLPSNPFTYLTINIDGTDYKVPVFS